MRKRQYIKQLTAHERAQMQPWADRWIEQSLSTKPADRERVERGIRAALRFAGKPEPKAIVWVDSPVIMAVSGPVAALTIKLLRRGQLDEGAVCRAVASDVGNAVDDAVGNAVDDAVDSAVRSAVGRAVESAVENAVGIAVNSDVRSAVGRAIDDAVRSAVNSAVESAVENAVRIAVNSDVRSAVGRAIDDAVRSAVNSAVESAVENAVRSAVDSVDDAVRSAVGSAVESAVDSVVHRDVYDTIGSAVHDAVRITVDSAVRSAVNSARTENDGAIRRAYLDAISQWWYGYLGGRWWSGYSYGWGLAYLTFFRDVAGLAISEDIAARLEAYENLMSAGWVWFCEDFVMVCEPPVILEREPEHGGVRRLHSLEGPAVAWRDGTALWFIHGIQVEQNVVESPETITAQQIQSERNAEVRRIMIDRFGAARYLQAIGAEVRHEDTDQYGFPRRLLVADIGDVEPLCMVEVVNSTPEPVDYQPDENAAGVWVGKRWHKMYSLRVDPKCETTQEALAWTFDVKSNDYRPLIET